MLWINSYGLFSAISTFFLWDLEVSRVRHAVLSKLECSLTLVKGFILGYDVFRVKNTNYPLILKIHILKAHFRFHCI